MTINLANFRTPDAIVLSGRPKGQGIRDRLRLGEIDNRDEPVIVEVPSEIISINSSFFLGLFGPSVRALGPDRFRQHYSFHCSPPIRNDVEDGIRQAVKESDPFKV